MIPPSCAVVPPTNSPTLTGPSSDIGLIGRNHSKQQENRNSKLRSDRKGRDLKGCFCKRGDLFFSGVTFNHFLLAIKSLSRHIPYKIGNTFFFVSSNLLVNFCLFYPDILSSNF